MGRGGPGVTGNVGRRWVSYVAAAAAAVLLAQGGPAPARAAAPSGLQVSGNQILLDGTPFAPRGFTLVAALAPACQQVDAVKAAQNFGDTELGALGTTWHANTVRFQVSQSVLAGPGAAAYVTTIQQYVTAAEAKNLVVILSMQSQGGLVCDVGNANPTMPTADTRTAWAALAPKFATDPRVMLELFNEPYDGPQNPKPSLPLPDTSWDQWRNGSATASPPTLGYQDLVTYLRGTLHVPNVLVADGLNYSGILPQPSQSAYLVDDPAANTAYSVHPYYDVLGASDWDYRFGTFAATAPVIATEWNYTTADVSASVTNKCGTAYQTIAPQLLAYMADRGMGVMAFAADMSVGSAVMAAGWTWAPNTCPGSADGPGPQYLAYATATQTPRPTQLTLTAAPTVLLTGGGVSLAGALQVAGRPVVDGVPVTVTRNGVLLGQVLTSGGTGSFTVSDVPPKGTASYTATFAGNGDTAASTAHATSTVYSLWPTTTQAVIQPVSGAPGHWAVQVQMAYPLGPISGARVTLWTHGASSTKWVKVGAATTGSDGWTYLTVAPKRWAAYRWRFAGSGLFAASVSNVVAT